MWFKPSKFESVEKTGNMVRIISKKASSISTRIVAASTKEEELDYVIPGNDDAIRAVKLIVSKMADAVIEANQGESLAEETEEASEAEAE